MQLYLYKGRANKCNPCTVNKIHRYGCVQDLTRRRILNSQARLCCCFRVKVADFRNRIVAVTALSIKSCSYRETRNKKCVRTR